MGAECIEVAEKEVARQDMYLRRMAGRLDQWSEQIADLEAKMRSASLAYRKRRAATTRLTH